LGGEKGNKAQIRGGEGNVPGGGGGQGGAEKK